MNKYLLCICLFLSLSLFSVTPIYMSKLQNLKVGMSKQQVIETIGSPSNQYYDKKTKTRRIIYNMKEHVGGWAETNISCCVELVNDSVTRWGRMVAGELIVMDTENGYKTIYGSDSTNASNIVNIEQKLQALRTYYDKGLITEEEFLTKKKEILDLL